MSYVLTLVSSREEFPVNDTTLARIEEILSQEQISLTCAPIWLSPNKAIDLGLSEKPSDSLMKTIRNYCETLEMDSFIITIDRRVKKLLLADMDSTIVSGETLDDVADLAGIGEEVKEITKRAMAGEIDFHSALRARVALLKGQKETLFEQALEETKLNLGAQTLIRTLKAQGTKTVLVSGGFTYFTRAIAEKCGFMHHYGNMIEVEHGEFTGNVLEPIQDKFSKVEHLQAHLNQNKLKPEQAAAIGDGANDLEMLKHAGLGMGYKAKQIVKDSVDNCIIFGDLTCMLFAMGIHEANFVQD